MTSLSLGKVKGLTDADMALVASLPKLAIVSLETSKNVTSAGIKQLAAAKGLRNPDVRRIKLSDDAFSAFAVHPSLRCLQMTYVTGMTDVGLADVGKISKLEVLDLDYVPFSDAGIVHLSGLTNLISLRLAAPGSKAARL